MKRMEAAKQKYDSIPIPDELSKRVRMEIEKADKIQHKIRINRKRNTVIKKTAAAAAAAAILFTVGVNSSETFAKAVCDLPLIGSIARVVTFRSYETKTEDAGISVDIPSVDFISADLDGLQKEVNEEIHTFCEQYADQALSEAAEYRQAFLETGGTKEEWAKHEIQIKVWYEVKAQTDQYLSLAVMGNNNWNHAGYASRYYNFDKKAGTWISLKDLLDPDQIPSAEESVRRQIKQREKETGMEFWGDEWKGIGQDTSFYINSAGNPVIVFAEYEIAPGAAGTQEFEVIK